MERRRGRMMLNIIGPKLKWVAPENISNNKICWNKAGMGVWESLMKSHGRGKKLNMLM